MILTAAVAALLLGFAPADSLQQPTSDHVTAARRVAATAQLAAQEYRIGVSGGRVVAPAEVEEARLFLTEARRSASVLPPAVRGPAGREIDALLALVGTIGPPDSLDARVRALASVLSSGLGVTLEELPSAPPPLARGERIYREQCAACHGDAGRGDGPMAAGLKPAPRSLADAAALRDASPLDFYRRVSIGVVGTAMPAFEARLTADDRWAVAAYATLLRLPRPRGTVPVALHDFGTTARMSDAEVIAALAATGDTSPGRLAAVRSTAVTEPDGKMAARVFARVRSQVDTAYDLARAGRAEAASGAAFDAYMTFEQVERTVRARNPELATALEASFATLRTRIAGGAAPPELDRIRARLAGELENAERVMGARLAPANLFVQSFVILVREGLEAILVVGALMAFLTKTGAGHRKREIHVGVGAAIALSLLTALALETVFRLSPAHREALEGVTMVAATVVLFYVSYWLLSKMEVAKWNRFVRSKVQEAVSSGSAFALASVAFLAVYREGFETVLFYKALFVAAGDGASAVAVALGMGVGAAVMALVYVAISRFGVRLPLKPLFAITSAFLYYMAFVFAGQGVAELQEGGLLSTTIVGWAPRIPALGIYPTVESLLAQGILLALLLGAILWTFVLEPRRLRVTSVLVPEPGAPAAAAGAAPPAPEPIASTGPAFASATSRELLRSLERMAADLAELRAEVERMRGRLTDTESEPSRRQ
ncbi:MAG TPA: FTR1 family protein [Gemmatimonadales bacterium]|nr:FTR1 family protein [Gemmatimonadales bacterium]